jgi:hypothetical protein
METTQLLYAIQSHTRLTTGVLLQMETLFEITSRTHPGVMSPEIRDICLHACRVLREAGDTLASTVERLIEQARAEARGAARDDERSIH